MIRLSMDEASRLHEGTSWRFEKWPHLVKGFKLCLFVCFLVVSAVEEALHSSHGAEVRWRNHSTEESRGTTVGGRKHKTCTHNMSVLHLTPLNKVMWATLESQTYSP